MQISLARRLAVLGGALVMLQGTMALAAQVDMFLTIDGIKGEAAGGAIHVTQVTHTANVQQGLASGRRMHSPITITKEVDAASPKLYQAMTSGKPLGPVTITFKGASGAGAGKAAESIKLTDPIITSIRKAGGNTEMITFTYATIEVTWTDGGKTSTDDWEVPK